MKSLGNLSVSVFKEAKVGFSGECLEQFERNGKCSNRQSRRRPLTWLRWTHWACSVWSWENSRRGGDMGSRCGRQLGPGRWPPGGPRPASPGVGGPPSEARPDSWMEWHVSLLPVPEPLRH